MQKSILEHFPDTDIRVSMVWIEMLPTDSFEAARKAASELTDPRVRHYFDPRTVRHAGTALADGILQPGRGPPWDVYLFYDQDAVWGAGPPPPVEWWHQLGGDLRADPSRFVGGVLEAKLHETMHALTGPRACPNPAPSSTSSSRR